jgi:hypothetical protein
MLPGTRRCIRCSTNRQRRRTSSDQRFHESAPAVAAGSIVQRPSTCCNGVRMRFASVEGNQPYRGCSPSGPVRQVVDRQPHGVRKRVAAAAARVLDFVPGAKRFVGPHQLGELLAATTFVGGRVGTEESCALTAIRSGLGANGQSMSQRSNPSGPEPIRSCSASSDDPGARNGSMAKFCVLPELSAAAVRRSSIAARIMVSVPPPDCPVDARRRASTCGCAASTSSRPRAAHPLRSPHHQHLVAHHAVLPGSGERGSDGRRAHRPDPRGRTPHDAAQFTRPWQQR